MDRQTKLAVAGITAGYFTVFTLVLSGGGPGVAPDPGPEGAGRAPAAREAPRFPQAPIPSDRPSAPKGAANVVLVILSTQRRDQWSVYGDPATTPFLADRAKGGVVMDDALAVAVDSEPAVAAILTGRYPHAIGTIDPAAEDQEVRIGPDAITLAERFAAAGWNTVGLTATAELNRGRGGAQGFDVFVDAPPTRTGAGELVRAALTKVAAREESARARPLYLQLVLVDSRKPLVPLEPVDVEPFVDPENDELGPYRATVRRQDDAISTLVAGLADQGLTEANTLFVVIADHGEGLRMPARHRPQHGIVLYGSSVSIPWIWWGHPLPRGRHVPGISSQIDLAPTLLTLAHAPPGEGAFDGMDLSAAVRGGSRSPRSEAYADTFLQGFHRASVWTSAVQCQADYGSTNRPPDDDFATACFDRVKDPDFATGLAATPPLRKRLDVLHAERLAALADKR